jgi:hypothetical protein
MLWGRCTSLHSLFHCPYDNACMPTNSTPPYDRGDVVMGGHVVDCSGHLLAACILRADVLVTIVAAAGSAAAAAADGCCWWWRRLLLLLLCSLLPLIGCSSSDGSSRCDCSITRCGPTSAPAPSASANSRLMNALPNDIMYAAMLYNVRGVPCTGGHQRKESRRC